MDKHFLELWGHALLHAAKSQKQLKDLAKCLPQALYPDFSHAYLGGPNCMLIFDDKR
jgi:hypothetical protein